MSGSGSILVVGGTRGTGLLIARRLHTLGAPVRVLARDPVRARRALGSDIEIVHGDITRKETLSPALRGIEHVIFTAGCRSGHPALESSIRTTEYEGVLHTLAAAKSAGLAGRFMYMTSSGVLSRTAMAVGLNLWKGNTLVWRYRAEEAIRDSSLEYTILRAGVLLNAPSGKRPILLTQEPLPLTPRYRIARADVAEVFVVALREPRAARATFEVVWRRGASAPHWTQALRSVKSDAELEHA